MSCNRREFDTISAQCVALQGVTNHPAQLYYTFNGLHLAHQQPRRRHLRIDVFLQCRRAAIGACGSSCCCRGISISTHRLSGWLQSSAVTRTTAAENRRRTVPGQLCCKTPSRGPMPLFSGSSPTLTGTPIAAPGAICEVDLDAFETARSENRVFQHNGPSLIERCSPTISSRSQLIRSRASLIAF